MATLILRPTSATGTSWTNVANVYDGDNSTLGSVTVKSSNYSSRGLTCNFDISGLANVTSARLVVIASQSSRTSTRRITVEASVNSTTYISTKLTNTSSNTLSADITSDINNAGTVKITGKNTSTNSNTLRVYEVYIEVEYTETTYTVTFKDWDGKILDTQTVTEGASATAPPNPTRDGYTFIGWNKGFTNVTSNLEVIAQYEENKTSVNINIGDISLSKVYFGDKKIVGIYLGNKKIF